MMIEIGTRLLNHKLLERYKSYSESVLGFYLDKYFNNLGKKIEFPSINETAKKNITEVIYRNNLMSQILKDQIFLGILNEEKDLKGKEVKVGVVDCIDGRLSILNQFGRSLNIKEVAGSLIKLNKERTDIVDRRFISVLEQSADSGRELLEIVTGHTSLKHKDHKCGRIGKGIKEGEFQGDPDQIAIKEAEDRSRLIEKKYNEILEAKGKPKQSKVSVTAMIDTDTMALIFNFGQKNELNSTKFTQELSAKIQSNVGLTAGDFGSMKDTFMEPEQFINYSKKVLEVTKYLMEVETKDQTSTVKGIINYIAANFSGLSEPQQKALLFTFCRTIANQYVTGLASHYSEHEEEYMVVAPSKPLGRFDLRQSFGSSPADREEMLDHVKTKLLLLDQRNSKKPNILFVSSPMTAEVMKNGDATKSAAEDAAKVYFQYLLGDDEIKNRIKNGTLLIVPVNINENNGEVLEIRDFSIYL